jgi:transposase
MLFDGHSAPSVAQNLGIGKTSLLYRWRAEILGREGRSASVVEMRVRQREERLRSTERERDIRKRALAIFGQGT